MFVWLSSIGFVERKLLSCFFLAVVSRFVLAFSIYYESFCCCCCFRDRVSLCISGCPETHFVDQPGLELKNPPASASQVLELKACATTAQRITDS